MFKNITLLLLLRTLAFYSVYIIKILNRKKYRLILAYRVAKNERIYLLLLYFAWLLSDLDWFAILSSAS